MNASVPGRPPRLDPFAIPSPLDARLWLATIAILSSSTVLLRWSLAISDAIFDSGRGLLLNYYNQLSSAGLAVVLLAALAILWLHPTWRIRRLALRPVSSADPDATRHLERMCVERGVSPSPGFLCDLAEPSVKARAFGRFRSSYVELSGGMLSTFYRDRPLFEAIVSHELAHLQNHDVVKTYFANALWYAYLAVVLVPAMLLLAVSAPAGGMRWLAYVAPMLGSVAVLTALVHLTRASVLRIREHLADVRASLWPGVLQTLERVLRQSVAGRSRMTAFRLHPGAADRLHVLHSTDTLFRLRFWEACAVGCTAGIACADAVIWIDPLFPVELGMWGILLAGAVLGFPVAAAVGGDMWREAVAELARDAPPGPSGLVGLGLSAGLVVGFNLAASIVASPMRVAAGLGPSLADLAYDGVVIASVTLALRWMRLAARSWLSAASPDAFPTAAYRAGLTSMSVVAGAGVAGLWGVGVQASVSHGDLGSLAAQLLVDVLGTPGTLAVIGTVLLFPTVAATLGGNRADRTWRWVFLDEGAARIRAAPPSLGDVWTAARVGVIGGVCAAVLWAVFALDADLLWLGLVIALSLAVVSVVAAARVTTLRVLYALLAAFAAACTAVALFGAPANRHDAGSLSVGAWIATFAVIANFGMFVAIPFAVVGARLARAWWPHPRGARGWIAEAGAAGCVGGTVHATVFGTYVGLAGIVSALPAPGPVGLMLSLATQIVVGSWAARRAARLPALHAVAASAVSGTLVALRAAVFGADLAFLALPGAGLGVLLVLGVTVLTRGRAADPPRTTGYGARSPDGRWWWDGDRWQPVEPGRS